MLTLFDLHFIHLIPGRINILFNLSCLLIIIDVLEQFVASVLVALFEGDTSFCYHLHVFIRCVIHDFTYN